jgi:hypothetical protein
MVMPLAGERDKLGKRLPVSSWGESAAVPERWNFFSRMPESAR